MTPATDPLVSEGHRVKPEWIDVYGHMNMARYAALFDEVGYALLDRVGVGQRYTDATRRGVFTVDVRIRYLKELHVDVPLAVSLRLLEVDHVRLHSFLELTNLQTGRTAATMEQLAVHASLESRGVLRFDEPLLTRLRQVVAAHDAAGRPDPSVLALRCEAPRGPTVGPEDD
ncbi:MAG: thioesterase [Comamonadaceae bacterium]|nr:MAG: thioesterase [Comamonadaceae bacterium]